MQAHNNTPSTKAWIFSLRIDLSVLPEDNYSFSSLDEDYDSSMSSTSGEENRDTLPSTPVQHVTLHDECPQNIKQIRRELYGNGK